MRLQISLLAAGLFIFSNSSLAASPITGNWFTYKAKAMVNITKCGTGLCGRISGCAQASTPMANRFATYATAIDATVAARCWG